jgi:hypothetical protein
VGRAIGNRGFQGPGFSLLACLAIEGGDAVRAIALSCEWLASTRHLEPDEDYLRNNADLVRILAMAAVALGQPTRAAQLFGVNAAIVEALGYPSESGPQIPAPNLYEDAMTAARVVLGEDAFAAAWEQGKALTLEEVFTLVLAPDSSRENT